jgi:hypothetical protein
MKIMKKRFKNTESEIEVIIFKKLVTIEEIETTRDRTGIEITL